MVARSGVLLNGGRLPRRFASRNCRQRSALTGYHKATEMVNFAQGDIMMLGGFVAYSAIVHWGLNYWVGGLIAIVVTAAFGYALDAIVLRRVIGQPQFAVVMLTLGLGFIFRAAAGITWGYDSVGFTTPFTNRVVNLGGIVLGQDSVSIIVG